MAILSRRPILLAILLYEQFLHLAQIDLYPNTQLLSTQQHAYQSFLVTSWFDSVCVTVACWVNFNKMNLHEHELQFSDNNARESFRPNVHISGRIFFFFLQFWLFNFECFIHGKKQKL